MFLVFAFLIGWLATVVWQLWLAETKGKVWSRQGYVARGSTVFDGCVFFYWVALGWGTLMLFSMVVMAIKQISH